MPDGLKKANTTDWRWTDWNPVTGEEENVLIDHAAGFVFKKAECASARPGEVRVKDLEFSYPDKAGFIAGTHYHN